MQLIDIIYISYIPFCRCNRSLPLSKTPGTATAPGLRSSRRRRAHSRPGRGPGDAKVFEGVAKPWEPWEPWRAMGDSNGKIMGKTRKNKGKQWEYHGKTMGISWIVVI